MTTERTADAGTRDAGSRGATLHTIPHDLTRTSQRRSPKTQVVKFSPGEIPIFSVLTDRWMEEALAAAREVAEADRWGAQAAGGQLRLVEWEAAARASVPVTRAEAVRTPQVTHGARRWLN